MPRMRRLLSAALFAAGVLLVLGGLVVAQAFTLGGTLASIAAVVALLYAGAVWLRESPRVAPLDSTRVPILFDRDARALTGSTIGQPIAATFPDMLRPEIERRCAAALAGASERFFYLHNGHSVIFDALPVRDGDGIVVYGLLIAAEQAPETAGTRVVAWSATGR